MRQDAANPSGAQKAGGAQSRAARPEEIELRPGLWCSLLECETGADMRVEHEFASDRIDFGFVLSGSFEARFKGARPGFALARSAPGIGGLKHLGPHCAVAEIARGERLRLLHLHVSPEALHALLRGDLSAVPVELRPVLEGGACGDLLRTAPMDPAVLGAAHQMFCHGGCGRASCLMLEGKALELLAMQLNSLSGGAAPGRGAPLGHRDLRAVREARDILVSDVAHTPSLPELSRQVGLGLQKLQAGFQQLYGTTLYGYLKECRLQKARMLFDSGGMNVSEVAWEIGYTNLSHFSAAFRRRFGVLPKQYSRAQQRGWRSSAASGQVLAQAVAS
ncbi:transcriptional regulator, AraC family [Humidesulfovibrio mexicanus]|uniref:Transcriptional regulator, AraC family n=1 Tax=Humidesulfovibrio mexicanus TaxID=147047 RepID=A0A238Y904_9BACT|nr:AraC family transcriptional regulator [Humidesulfovibrio mexicanus]SNR67064.1 transcriptional regulator, AraC family [Humidesulfovibrio mexicanus]